MEMMKSNAPEGAMTEEERQEYRLDQQDALARESAEAIEMNAGRKLRDLNFEARRVHEANAKWWLDISVDPPVPLKRNVGEMGMLAISELAEALEGHRKNLKDDKLPQYPMAVVELADCVIRVLDTVNGLGFAINQAGYIGALEMPVSCNNFGKGLYDLTKILTRLYDALATGAGLAAVDDIRYFTLYTIAGCEALSRKFFPGVDFWEAYEAKMKYNAERADHKIEHRRSAHGKKY